MALTVRTVDGRALWRIALISHGIPTSFREADVPDGTGCRIAANRSIFADHTTRKFLIDL
jgi:hypothetical protein